MSYLKKLLVLSMGGSVMLAGFVMLFIPGPGIAGILLGLAILAGEFWWARRILEKLKERLPARARKQAGSEDTIEEEQK